MAIISPDHVQFTVLYTLMYEIDLWLTIASHPACFPNDAIHSFSI